MPANDIHDHPKAMLLRAAAAKAFAEPAGEEQTKRPMGARVAVQQWTDPAIGAVRMEAVA